MQLLTSDWTVIDSVDGGEILAKNIDNVIYVSYPTCLPFNVMAIIVAGLADIDVGDDLTLSPGPSEGEMIATFTYPEQPARSASPDPALKNPRQFRGKPYTLSHGKRGRRGS